MLLGKEIYLGRTLSPPNHQSTLALSTEKLTYVLINLLVYSTNLVRFIWNIYLHQQEYSPPNQTCTGSTQWKSKTNSSFIIHYAWKNLYITTPLCTTHCCKHLCNLTCNDTGRGGFTISRPVGDHSLVSNKVPEADYKTIIKPTTNLFLFSHKEIELLTEFSQISSFP